MSLTDPDGAVVRHKSGGLRCRAVKFTGQGWLPTLGDKIPVVATDDGPVLLDRGEENEPEEVSVGDILVVYPNGEIQKLDLNSFKGQFEIVSGSENLGEESPAADVDPGGLRLYENDEEQADGDPDGGDDEAKKKSAAKKKAAAKKKSAAK